MVYAKTFFLINVIPFVRVEISFGDFVGFDVLCAKSFGCNLIGVIYFVF